KAWGRQDDIATLLKYDILTLLPQELKGFYSAEAMVSAVEALAPVHFGSGQRGKTSWKICRLTSPWSWLTPLTAPLPRTARYAMLKPSESSLASTLPSASNWAMEIPNSRSA